MNWLRRQYRNYRRPAPNYRLTYSPNLSTLIDLNDPNARLQLFPTGPTQVLPISYKSPDLDECMADMPSLIPDCDIKVLQTMGFDVTQTILGANSGVFYGVANERAQRYHVTDTTEMDGKYRVESFTGLPVAVKLIRMRDTYVDVKRQEAETMTNLKHPNVVELYEVLVIGKRLYLIMEYCSGGTLGQFIRKCTKDRVRIKYFSQFPHEILTLSMCESFYRQLLAGLLYLHSQLVFHNDLHAGNVFLVRSDTDPDNITLKYADFGLSMVIGNRPGEPEHSRDDRFVEIVRRDYYQLGWILSDIAEKVFDGDDRGVNKRLRKLAFDLMNRKFVTLAAAEDELNIIIGSVEEEVV